MEEMSEPAERLRCLVTDLLDKNLPRAAVFFADKLVSLSDGAAADVFALAQALVADGQHLRALQLLRSESLDSAGVRCRHLAGQCLLATGTPEEALSLLGDEDGGTRSEFCLLEESFSDSLAAETRATAASPCTPPSPCFAAAATPSWRTGLPPPVPTR